MTRAGDEPQFSGLPPVRAAHLATTGKTMWPLARAGFPATVEEIPPHQLPSSDTAEALRRHRQSVSAITRTP